MKKYHFRARVGSDVITYNFYAANYEAAVKWAENYLAEWKEIATILEVAEGWI